MVMWRPAKVVRVKVLGLAWRGERLLAAEVEADDGRIKGVRPLGGTIEFGETREEALAREFLEELGTRIRITGPWLAMENIYRHEGHVGHEIIFAADVAFEDPTIADREIIAFDEGGIPSRARWFGPAELAAEGLELYPVGLRQALATDGRRWR